MSNQSSNKSDGGSQNLVQRSIQVDLEVWNKARRKAVGLGSLSEVVRKLLHLWTEGKINLEDYED